MTYLKEVFLYLIIGVALLLMVNCAATKTCPTYLKNDSIDKNIEIINTEDRA